jgi:hypothetical protein
MNTFLENQNWRYATKKFDATKTITDEENKRSNTFKFIFFWITTL